MADDGYLRIGDDERRATDARLQRAHGEGRLSLEEYEERSARAWAARTRDDLAGLTDDLPPDGTTALPAPAGDRTVRARTGDVAAEWARRAGAVLGAAVLAGAALWGGSALLAGEDGTVIFGERTLGVPDGRDRIEAGLLFGSVTVVVPDDARISVGGMKLFGSTECLAACSGAGPREIAVDVSGAFGSTEILTRSEAAATPPDDDRADRGDDQDDRDD